eukprot:m51a1_g13140 hypothetical protein (317) ;mRNA; r:122-1213
MSNPQFRVSPSVLGHALDLAQCRRYLALRSSSTAPHRARWERLQPPSDSDAPQGPQGALETRDGGTWAPLSPADSLAVQLAPPEQRPAGCRRLPDAPGSAEPPRALGRALVGGGLRWERELLARLESAGHVIHGDFRGAAASQVAADDVRRLLASAAPEGSRRVFVYQATLVPPAGLVGGAVECTRCFPDLVEVRRGEGGRRTAVVIDAKASASVRPSHKVQVALYALVLDALLREWGIGDLRVSDEGGVWLRGDAECSLFPLGPPREHALRLLRSLGSGPSASATPSTSTASGPTTSRGSARPPPQLQRPRPASP